MWLSQYRVCSNFPFFFYLPLHCLLSRELCLLLPPPLFFLKGWAGPFFPRTSGLECLIPLPPLCQDCRNVSPHLALLTFFAKGIQSGKENLCLLSLQVSGTPPALIAQCLDNWYLSHSPTSLSGLPDLLPVCYNYDHSLCPLLYYYLLLLLFVVCLVPNK